MNVQDSMKLDIQASLSFKKIQLNYKVLSLDKEWLRVKSGRSKGCKDCISHRCIPTSCNCNCHKWIEFDL